MSYGLPFLYKISDTCYLQFPSSSINNKSKYSNVPINTVNFGKNKFGNIPHIDIIYNPRTGGYSYGPQGPYTRSTIDSPRDIYYICRFGESKDTKKKDTKKKNN